MAHIASSVIRGCLGVLLAAGVSAEVSATNATEDEALTARSLATLLRAARTVVSNNQALINDEKLGDKGLSAEKVLGESLAIYTKQTGVDPTGIDPESRHGRLLRAQMDAIRKVVNDAQRVINKQGIGFKGFIPSAFARMVNDEFQEKMGAEAEVKVTAPPALIRNRKARPDSWEAEMITSRLSKEDWPKGQPLEALAPYRGREAYRFLIPEYYAASCLACHGSPKSEIDITGYPKEGGKEGDLGGVISVTLRRP